MDGPVDDIDRHRALRASPRVPALGRASSTRRSRRGFARSPRTGTRSGASSSTRTTSSRTCPRRMSSGRARPSTARFEWLRANRDAPFFLYVHNWATHMPYDIAARGSQELARGEDGDHRRHPVRLGVGARVDAGVATGRRSSASRRFSSPRSSRSSSRSACASRRRSRSSPTTASRGASASRRRAR